MNAAAAPEALVEQARRIGSLPGLPSQHLIGGRWLGSESGARMDSFDPGRGRPFAEFAAGGAAEADAAVRAAREALAGPWRRVSPAERGRVLLRCAELIREEALRLAIVETLDSGKPLREARGDIAGAARAFEFYAGACDKFNGETLPQDGEHLAYTLHEPIGVVVQIVPWNYPFSTAVRGVAPALAAGCSVVLKPAEQTPFTALMLGEILLRAGLPPGVCNVVTGTGSEVGAALAAHPGVDHLTFTGSVASGQAVMRAAAGPVTRVVLELGAKSPVVVLADADLDSALDNVMGAIFENAGQICSAGSRLVIDRRIHAAFVERLVERAGALTLGHGLSDPGMGPLVSAAQLQRVAGFVEGARSRGVQVLCGGRARHDAATGAGWFYEPTVLDGLQPDDACVQQEIFGPVLCVQPFDGVDEALALANGTPYALVAGVFTRDFAQAHRLAREIDAGQVYINEFFAGGIEVPFGGNRRSGFGRAKGLEALRTYSKLKAVAARL